MLLHSKGKYCMARIRCAHETKSPRVWLIVFGQGAIMAKDRLFVERRLQGDYAIRKPNSERASNVRPTQREAIERARELNPGQELLVERVRHTDRGNPDKWRKP